MKKIRKIYGTHRIGLYIDNAGFHIATSVKKYANENDMELIYAPAYSPEY